MIAILFAFIQIIGLILFKFYGWVGVVAFLGYLVWQNGRRQQWVGKVEHTLLKIEVPKENEKKELSAEQMFASLHGILRTKQELIREGSLQEHISFEIAATGGQIQFYVWTPTHLKDFVEGQIYAQYPSVHISEATEDYSKINMGERVFYGTELLLTKKEVLPIKTFPSFEVDPLAGITAVLSKLEQVGEEMWIQVIARPIDDSWQDKGYRYIETVKAGHNTDFLESLLKALIELPLYILGNFMHGMAGPKEGEKKKEDKKETTLSTGQSTIIKAVEEKIAKLGYVVKIRIVYLGPDQTLAKQRLQAIVGGFKQFNTTNLNGFTTKKTHDSLEFMEEYNARLFIDHGSILNIEELASLYHLPHKSVETPNMVWTSVKTAEPPPTLPSEITTDPEEVSLFGQTNFRGRKIKFGIKRTDRGRHLYIIGQTGVGKSQLLQLLALSDLYHNEGIAIIDPHGDFATDIMQYIPEHRIKDVIYFNPTDRDFPIAFNPLEVLDANFKHDISSELVGVLKRMFEAQSWGPRLEHILRFTTLALLDYPNSTMLGITRMLTEKDFRKKVVRAIQDPVVKNFWVNEFAGWNEKFANEAVAPVLNKVGAFTANPLIRNVIGQPKSSIDLRKIMDEGKILVVNLSHGQIGESNAAILGALMVTKIQLAAMSRADIPRDERRPFYLYVDEFQSFATDSFAVILSEARKYGLYLTVANQYIAQIAETAVKDAVFGNVGSIISFRVGADDASYLAKYLEPTFEAADLVKLNNQNIFISMSIDGEKSQPFSARTLIMPPPNEDHTKEIVALSRERYASSREDVEDRIAKWSRSTLDEADNTESAADEQKPNLLTELKNPDVSPTSGHQPHSSGSNRENRQPNQPAPIEYERRANTHNPNEVASEELASAASEHSNELQRDEIINLR